jgi:RNA polymerase sigma-70 factor (ECF subfamily)
VTTFGLIQPLPLSVKFIMLRHEFHEAGEQVARPRPWIRPRRARMTTLREGADAGKRWSACVLAVAKARDREQFAQLFAHFAPRLKSFFLRMGVPAGTAEDLAQDTMLAVWKKAPQFDPDRASASTWIFTIARNLRIDLKRRERDPNKLMKFFELVPEPLPGEQMIVAERDKRVRAALAGLSQEQATVIRLSFFDERAHSEIARVLNIPLGTVKSRTRLAMNRLRLLIEGEQ